MRRATARANTRHGLRRNRIEGISLVSVANGVSRRYCRSPDDALPVAADHPVTLRLASVYTKLVADATNRLKPFRIGRVVFDLAPQAVDLHVDLAFAGRVHVA